MVTDAMKWIIRIGALLVVGCASQPPQMMWQHPQANAQLWHTDSGQCEAQALGTAGAVSMNVNTALRQSIQQERIFGACMRGKGWFEAPAR